MDSVAVPSCIPDSVQVTWPVGAANPGGALALTVAVKTTAWPKTGAAGAADMASVTGALTTWSNLAWADGKVLSPLYRAMMLCEPPASAEVVKTACLPKTLTLPSAVAPSENCTVPVGNPEDGDWPLTAAVNVTAWPSAVGLALLVKNTDEVAGSAGGATVTVTLPLLAEKLPAGVYAAWIVWLPNASVLRLNVATPKLRFTFEASVVEVVKSVKVTVPAGVLNPRG
jgi:hypothetical protein